MEDDLNTLLKKEFKFPDLSTILSFGKEVETKIQSLEKEINIYKEYLSKFHYPSRFLAIKLLEDDEEIKMIFEGNEESQKIIDKAVIYRRELEEYHGEDIHTIISSEIYNDIHQIIEKVEIVKSKEKIKKLTFADKLDHLTTHSVWGYVILILVIEPGHKSKTGWILSNNHVH